MKKLLALLLSLLVVISIVLGGGVFLWYQPAAAIVDRTMNTAESADVGVAAQTLANGQSGGTDGDTEPNTATLNSRVELIVGEEADAVYAAVQATTFNEEGQLEMTMGADTALNQLNDGDVFFLDGDETTLFQGPYIGKVADTYLDEGGNNVVTIENAALDEAFDSLNVDINQTLTEDNLIRAETVDGVELEFVDDVQQAYDALPGGSGLSDPQPLTEEELATATTHNSLTDSIQTVQETETEALASAQATPQPEENAHGKSPRATGENAATDNQTSSQGSSAAATTAPDATSPPWANTVGTELEIKKDGFVASLNLDLSKVFGGSEGSDNNGNASQTSSDNSSDSGEKPEESWKVTGKLSVSNLETEIKNDWSLSNLVQHTNTLGFREFEVNYTADIQQDITLTGSLSKSLDQSSNQFTVGSCMKMEGLANKAFPLFCLQFTAAGPITVNYPPEKTSLASLQGLKSLIPTLMLVAYMDMNGKVSLDFSMSYITEYKADNTFTAIQDYSWVMKHTKKEKEDFRKTVKVEASFTADMGLSTGVALDVFLCGVNIFDMSIVKLGMDMQGTGGLKFLDSNKETDDGEMDASFTSYLDCYARLYLQFIDIHFKMSATLTVLSQDLLKLGFDELSLTLVDITLSQFGNLLPTYYDADTMSVGNRTAEDEQAIYYVTEDGEIAKQSKKNGIYTILCEDSLTRFVGIDENYLYYIKPADNDGYDLCRVGKNNGLNRVIMTEVYNVLAQDATRLFYTTTMTQSTIRALDRQTLEDKTFSSFEDNVEIMRSHQNQYYVLTVDDGIFSFFFGSDLHYYLIDQDGRQVRDLGENPEPGDLPRWGENFTQRLVSSGQLRPTASDVYWIPAGSGDAVEVKGISGWADMGDDVAVTQNAPSGSENPYIIRRYSAATGTVSDVVSVKSNQAFFTFCQDKNGYWYYFDEDTAAGEMYLYRLDPNLSNRTLLQTYSHEEFGVSLESCGMEQLGGKLIFYSITGDDSSASGKTLLRYNIY